MLTQSERNSTVKISNALQNQWYAAATKPSKEALAVQNLANQGFKPFLPRFLKTWRSGRNTGTRLAPLFPGYVFVSCSPVEAPWRQINSTLGIKRLLGSEFKPLPVPPDFMRALLGRCKNGVVDSLVDRFEAGMEVSIVAGPFASRIAVIEHYEAPDRVHLLLEVLGTSARLAVNANQLAPRQGAQSSFQLGYG